MSDLWVNIRIGTRHLLVARGFKYIRFESNPYFAENKPESFIKVHEFFGLVN